MFDYFPGIAWLADAYLFIAIILTSIAIFFCAAFKEYLWEKRRRGLLSIKNNVYEMVLAGERPSESVCRPFAAEATPQQFLDIETNRNMGAAFFNDSERQLFKNCFITPGQIKKIEKRAAHSISKWRRIEAMLSLGYMQAESAIGVFKRALLCSDKDIAYYSMVALGQMKTVKSAVMLLNFLEKHPAGGYKIASILEGFPKEIADDVIKLTYSRNALVRFWAATILSKFASERHINKIEKLTHDASAEVRAAACDCLGYVDNHTAKQALLKCLKDDNWLVKRRAVFALEHIMGDASVPEVISLINDSSWSVVDAVKDVMTRHIKASLPYIEKFMAGEDHIPKKYSIVALENAPDDLDPSTKDRMAKILTKEGSGR
jgi:hypothetical protein